MNGVLIALGILLALFLLISLALQMANSKIRNAPLAFPMDIYLAEPEGEEIYVEREDGTKIRCISAGSGQAVILAHGYGASLAGWNVMSASLVKKGYQVIMFDQRGHEKSTIGAAGKGHLLNWEAPDVLIEEIEALA